MRESSAHSESSTSHTPLTTDTPSPRRKWHLQRWLLLLAAGFLAYGGWTQYAFRAALKEAWALGWTVYYVDPYEEIRADWKAALRKATWLDGVTKVEIPTSEEFEQHLAILHRLNPKELVIFNSSTLRDLPKLNGISRLRTIVLIDCKVLTNVDALKNLSALKKLGLLGYTGLTDLDALRNLSALRTLGLHDCTRLTDLAALKNLSGLKQIYITGCTGLTNVDALKNLSALQYVHLTGCTGLSEESVVSLKAALPNAKINGP